jgi:acetylornithine deacetylase
MDLQTVTDLLSKLVAIDSVNPDLVPGAAGEGELAEFVAAWLAGRGLEVQLQAVAPGRPNVIAVAHGRGNSRSERGRSEWGRNLLLNAHMDTVGVAGMAAPFAADVRDGRLYGRGAVDTKGGLAAFMLAAAAAQESDLAGDVILTAVVDEEYGSLGTSALMKDWAPAAGGALVAEPTDLKMVTAHKGFVWLDVETQGVAAHGSRPAAGVDAIAKMGPVLVAIDELARRFASGPRHPLLGPPSVHASLISGGQEVSSYPAACRLTVERRTLPGETPAAVEAEWLGILARAAAADPAFRATLRMGLSQEPLEVPPDAAILEVLRTEARQALGREPVIAGFSGWTDAALIGAAGIPAIIFGPIGEGYHGVEEWVDLESVQQCAAITLAVAQQFCT